MERRLTQPKGLWRSVTRAAPRRSSEPSTAGAVGDVDLTCCALHAIPFGLVVPNPIRADANNALRGLDRRP